MPNILIANFLFFRPKCTFPLPVMSESTVIRGNITGNAIRRIHRASNTIGKAIEIRGKASSTMLVIINNPNNIKGGNKKIENNAVKNFVKPCTFLPKMKTP